MYQRTWQRGSNVKFAEPVPYGRIGSFDYERFQPLGLIVGSFGKYIGVTEIFAEDLCSTDCKA